MSWLQPLHPTRFTMLCRKELSAKSVGRRGKITPEMKRFIDGHCAQMTFRAMGRALGLNESCVRKYYYRIRNKKE